MPLEYFQSKELKLLQGRLLEWFSREARDLPWRRTKNPYHIWLSEIILQQTQVVQGMAYYHRFTETYPTVQDLASAEEDEVLLLWQGLGYYSRARNLLRSARMIVEDFGGAMPQTIDEIKLLPGVGPYTQAAVLSFAFDLPYATVDGNVYRVLSRLYALDESIDKPKGQKLFRELAQNFLNLKDPAQHNQAMIELGAICCSPRNPNCLFCPFETHCLSYMAGNPMDYPKKVGKIKIKERHLNYFYIRIKGAKEDGEAKLSKEKGNQVLIHRRGEGDIWQGLYELPLIETKKDSDITSLVKSKAWKELAGQFEGLSISSTALAECKHRLTHQLLQAKLYMLEAKAYQPSDKAQGSKEQAYQVIEEQELSNYAMPVLLNKLMEQIH